MHKSGLALLCTLTLAAGACSSLGWQPSVMIAPERPTIASDLTGYQDKRAVILAPREPRHERGFGRTFGSYLFAEMSRRAPFRQIDYRPEQVWYGLQSAPAEEYATAAAQAADLGFDLAVVVSVDRVVHSRNADNLLELEMRLIDTLTGEAVHVQRLSARGKAGSLPSFWDPSLNKPVERDDLLWATANTLVRRMWVRWDQGETEQQFLERHSGADQAAEEEEESPGATIGG